MENSVLLISHGFQPSYEKGFANGLASNGVPVELVSSDRTLTSELASEIKAINLRGSQDPRRSIFTKAANLIRYAFSLVRQVSSGNYAVVHLTGTFITGNSVVGLIEWLTYRLIAKRFFMTVHNLLPHDRHTRFNALVYSLVYQLPDKLVVHTSKMKSELMARFHIQADRILIMQHGVDALPEVFHVPEPNEKLRVLLFGGLNRYKGIDILLQALQLCPDLPIELVIAGECRQADYAQEIEMLIAGLRQNHTVRWERGFIAEDKMGAYFEAADVVALPYRHIDQSGVLFTAFRFGVPVIATDVGAFRETVPDFAGIIAEQSTPVALAQVLRNFYAHRYEFDRTRIRAHAHSLTWPKTVRSLVSEYKLKAHSET